MLREVVKLILSAGTTFQDGTVFASGVLVDSDMEKVIDFLNDRDIIENTNYENKLGNTVDLELSISGLNKIGYYQTKDDLIQKNRYKYPSDLFWVADLRHFSDELIAAFFGKFELTIRLIDAIIQIAKHSYTDVDLDYALITNDDKALLIPLRYSSGQVDALSVVDYDQINLVIGVFEDTNTEKKLIFVNELIDYLSPVTELERFGTLLRTVADFTDKCQNAYQYYLRDFSYNKLKIELDSKALEFTQKIQGVINDSQTKLVTIPTAFVLVFAAFDFEDLSSVKNLIAVVSLFIFAILIQVFLNNQYSSLNFTAANVAAYKETFSLHNIAKFQDKFTVVDEELNKQRGRLCLITWVLWAIPSSLLVIWCILLLSYHPAPH